MADGRLRAYVLDVSYFSGKLEAYLRWKEIPYERVEVRWDRVQGELRRATGVAKVPVLHTSDGLWLQDTTPILDWLEARHPEGAVLPEDPFQAFFCRLLEDWADEWLWRPALHYRWSHASDARLLSHRIAAEAMGHLPLPTAWVAAFVRRRQHRTYVSGDGVGPATRAHVEGVYLGALERLERLLRAQPFLLGERPSLADFGLFGPMFRHFSLDPTPARLMRDRAPAVYEWVARLWNARASRLQGAAWPAPGALPPVWRELVGEIGAGYLPALHANAAAWRSGARRHDFTVQGVTYRGVPVVRYRVWCRERLQDHFEALPEAVKPAVREELERGGAWEPLWRDGRIASHLFDGVPPPVCPPAPHTGGALRGLLPEDPWNPAPRRPVAAARSEEPR
jgi:glutathione S-transferase